MAVLMTESKWWPLEIVIHIDASVETIISQTVVQRMMRDPDRYRKRADTTDLCAFSSQAVVSAEGRRQSASRVTKDHAERQRRWCKVRGLADIVSAGSTI